MKKLIAVTLILAVLALPASGLGGSGKFGDQEITVFGRWTMYYDAREYNQTAIVKTGFDVISLDLYIFENGSCYLLPFRMQDGKVEKLTSLDGIWFGSGNTVTMKFDDLVYTAEASWGSLKLTGITGEFTLYPVHSTPEAYFGN